MANKPATYATDHSSSVLHGFCIRWPVVPWLVHSGSSERGHCTRGWAYSTDTQTSFASSQALYLLFPTHTHTHTKFSRAGHSAVVCPVWQHAPAISTQGYCFPLSPASCGWLGCSQSVSLA